MKKLVAFIALAITGAITPALADADPHAVKVSVGYADTLVNPPGFTPTPWSGTPGVIFRGGGASFDAGAILLVNPSAETLTVDNVTVDLENHLSMPLWGFPIKIPGKGAAVLTQMKQFDFDTSDTSTSGTCTNHSSFIPVVHVTVGEKNPLTKDFTDKNQVLNTGGFDPSGCFHKNEGAAFQEIH